MSEEEEATRQFEMRNRMIGRTGNSSCTRANQKCFLNGPHSLSNLLPVVASEKPMFESLADLRP